MTIRAMLRTMIVTFAHGAVLLPLAVADEARPRLLVLTDIGGDPDDQQSMVRLMVYSNEFEIQARMDWCVKPRSAANHAPVAVCNGDETQTVLTQRARSGSTIRLSTAASCDPDGDRLTYRWWVYFEAGTYPAKPAMTAADAAEVTITLPPNAVGDLHVILEMTDAGQPPLTTYRRVVVTVD